MTWILAIAGGLSLLVVAAFAVGHFMSPDYSGRVRRRVDAPPAAVFAALLDVEACPQAGSMCRAVVRGEEGGLPAWTEDLGSTQVSVRTLELEPERRIVREMTDSVVPMKARWELELAPDGDGTELVLAHRGRIDDGTWHVPLFRLLVKGFGMGDRGARQYLDAVARRASP